MSDVRLQGFSWIALSSDEFSQLYQSIVEEIWGSPSGFVEIMEDVGLCIAPTFSCFKLRGENRG
jgi:hypothetical protein